MSAILGVILGVILGRLPYPDGTRYDTIGSSLFDAAAKALEWVEVDCQTFGCARRYRDDHMLEIGVGMVPDRWYRVS